MRRFLLFIGFLLFTVSLRAQEKQIVVSYTLADRDRTIRIESRMDAIETRMNTLETRMIAIETRMNALDESMKSLELKMDKSTDRLEDKFIWGFGLLLVSIFGLICFIIYDRRTFVAPLESKTDRIIKSLKEAAEKDPNLRDALKKTMLW